jgi:hypothetical protein
MRVHGDLRSGLRPHLKETDLVVLEHAFVRISGHLCAEIRCSTARASEDQELLAQEEILSDETLSSAGFQDCGECAQQMRKYHEEFLHRGGSLMGAIAGGKSIDRPSGTPACEFAMDR